MEKATAKFRTILISVGNRTRVYRSVAEVPPRLRRELIESTSGKRSATVLIADERGRQEILKSLEGAPSELGWPAGGGGPRGRRSGRRLLGLSGRQWGEVALLAGIGLCVWALSVWR